jgi:multiple antibiotic resistance protein
MSAHGCWASYSKQPIRSGPELKGRERMEKLRPNPRRQFSRAGEILHVAAIGLAAVPLLITDGYAQVGSELPASRVPALSQVFVLFFVMLGPIKIIAPFALMMRDAEDKSRRKVALHAFAIASLTTLIAAAVGRAILDNWHVSLGALLIAGGVILFLVALRLVLQQYAPTPEVEAHPSDSALADAAVRLAFPTIVTPYGIATVIIILSVSPNTLYVVGVGTALVGVMILNLFAMLYAREILKVIGIMPLQIVGTVLSVLQVALGVQMILGGLRIIGVLP